ncbi:CAMK protein kinase [Coniosporium apollinis CBS 100218]|uniref:CAMK protein kinase n=1 Tax=Coniosporium apollinis (strain CBS 100218) TaxID=1168221 RepID=R7YS86_CONA1|nr:CAMK protein kinase [Coniosporium apollinis CBS 100218]EON64516.1 CAMK protein kinase [Coniosporium apollinis CBS 100218]
MGESRSPLAPTQARLPRSEPKTCTNTPIAELQQFALPASCYPRDNAVYSDDETYQAGPRTDFAAANTQPVSHTAALPATNPTAHPLSLPHIPAPPCVRTPSDAGLHLRTDLDALAVSTPQDSPVTPTIVESKADSYLSHAATAPIPIQGQVLRTRLSQASMASSLSPGSALSSPMLNSLQDITPLPSPLVTQASPGPWHRAATTTVHPSSRGGPSSLPRDESFNMLSPAALDTSPPKRKTYGNLTPGAADGLRGSAERHNAAAHARNRSLSEYIPEPLHNTRPRNVTLPGMDPQSPDRKSSITSMHREAYLAAQRGLDTSTNPAGPSNLPTPPPSNRSSTSTSEPDLQDSEAEVPAANYLTIRLGASRKPVRYLPLRQLGQGTFSKVLLCTSQPGVTPSTPESSLNRRALVAVKVVHHGPAGGADEERIELSLKREVEMLKRVKHPCIVRLRAFDCDDEKALLVLGYCPGGDLFEMASERREMLTEPVVRRMFAELVGAVRYLHGHNIVHRDIKLENVLVNLPLSALALLNNLPTHPNPLITLTDLGLSRLIDPASPLLTTRCGSEDYAAPEILLGQSYDGRQTDAWALGVLLYALVEGRLPFDPAPAGPGKRRGYGGRGRTVHRIARCDWVWWRCGDEEGEWDPARGRGWEGVREVVEGLLKKVSRGRKSLEEVEGMEWVRRGIQVEGGLKKGPEDGLDGEEELDVETPMRESGEWGR